MSPSTLEGGSLSMGRRGNLAQRFPTDELDRSVVSTSVPGWGIPDVRCAVTCIVLR